MKYGRQANRKKYLSQRKEKIFCEGGEQLRKVFCDLVGYKNEGGRLTRRVFESHKREA